MSEEPSQHPLLWNVRESMKGPKRYAGHPVIQANLFVPFFTTKPAGVGTGLGLYSAKAITEKHGGQISVQSEVNKGTTFSLHFPAFTQSPK